MNAFIPQPYRRTHCAVCGTPRTAHDHQSRACPEIYRPGTLEAAQRELAAARVSGDESRVFVARGEVQRLGGDADE